MNLSSVRWSSPSWRQFGQPYALGQAVGPVSMLSLTQMQLAALGWSFYAPAAATTSVQRLNAYCSHSLRHSFLRVRRPLPSSPIPRIFSVVIETQVSLLDAWFVSLPITGPGWQCAGSPDVVHWSCDSLQKVESPPRRLFAEVPRGTRRFPWNT